MFIQPQNLLLTGMLSSQNGRADSRASNENSFDAVLQNTNNVFEKKNEDINRDIALINEVGFYQYQIIMKTVNQIEKALEKAKADFPAYKDDLEGIEDIFADKLPTSIVEAMSRLNKALEGVPEEIRESFKEKVLQYLEEEKKKNEKLAGVDSRQPFLLI
ncbi:MAG: hypothetical protein GY860_08800 [Desulfobacteraceae bacterium]|nr:hypothetical protein [Desulfobacteraceae bacterium]